MTTRQRDHSCLMPTWGHSPVRAIVYAKEPDLWNKGCQVKSTDSGFRRCLLSRRGIGTNPLFASLLYKYVTPDLVAETPRPLRILQTMQLLVANPCSFNDPFEVRPAFDQERHDHAARTSEAFHWRMLGIENPLFRDGPWWDKPQKRLLALGNG